MDKTLPQSDPNATDRYADLILAASGDGIYGVRSEERRVRKEGRSRWSPYH